MSEIKFNNITTIENKIANSFLQKAEEYFSVKGEEKEFVNFYNLFNSLCNNKTFDPNQFVMDFQEKEPLTEEEKTQLNKFKLDIIQNRKTFA